MSLATHISTQLTKIPGSKCKTCNLLRDLTEEDRVDFIEAVESKVPGSILARALNARAEEAGLSVSLGETSVRLHIRQREQHERQQNAA